ncbi:uncharacterized protein LOC111704140 [Eurytemora carolleeae]|uniref:uncharacterized protein LOC111704140 n=1 Tax=Eurytemora carolleeae TaxID=1294199 RepID=UPI000C77918C|nr:uncharacterized protein LOC111704140 [Eurytemora carolleeae]|eukprot:XP_023332049.1 uncharacterized protein LOC111704140 [Eurytemora affinis]
MSANKSIASGISCMAQLGATMAGEVAGVEIELDKHTNQQTDSESFEWNDSEEERYRDWIREQVQEKAPAEFEEFMGEQLVRQRFREQTEQNADNQINWEDEREQAYRAKYIQIRGSRDEINWNTDTGERKAQERSRMLTAARSKQKLEWDDQDEKACMERYRKKY